MFSLTHQKQTYKTQHTKYLITNPAEQFLTNVVAVDNLEGFEKLFILNDGLRGLGHEELDGLQDTLNRTVDATIPKQAKTFADVYYSPHAYVYRNKQLSRTTEHVGQVSALVLDYDNVPLSNIKVGLKRQGLKPHYIVQTRPTGDHYHAVILLRPKRVGKGNRKKIVNKYEAAQTHLAKATGADLGSAKFNQMFRLVGSWRRTDIGCYQIQANEINTHARYKLEKLPKGESSKGKSKQTFRGYKVQSKGDTNVLNAPPIKQILNSTVVEGSRNTAATALAYAYHIAGLDYNEAKTRLVDWTKTHTSPTYPANQAVNTVKSAYRYPRGLRHEKLQQVETVEHGYIDEDTAKEVYKHLPDIKQEHKLKPTTTNRPQLESIVKVLEYLVKHHPAPQSTTRTLHNATGVPTGTIDTVVKPFLAQLDIKLQHERPTAYDTRPLATLLYYDFINRLDLDYTTEQILWYLNLRAPDILKRLRDLINRVRGLANNSQTPRERANSHLFNLEPLNRTQPRGPI